LYLLARADLAGRVEDAPAASFPTAGVLARETRRVEAVHRDDTVTGPFNVDDGVDREDVDDPAVTPMLAVERHRLQEQRECYGHVHRPGHGDVGVRRRPEVVDAVVLDAPGRGVGRYLQVAQPSVAKQPAVGRLYAVTFEDAAEAAARAGQEAAQPRPCHVDIVLGP
jgi:hypothetical protein